MNTQYTNRGAGTDEIWSADRIKELTLSKIHNSSVIADRRTAYRLKRRFATAAAVIVLTIAVATTALAVSGIIDFGTIFSSIFHSKEAAPYIHMGDGITMQSNDGEVSVEPIAAFYEVGRSGMYLELRITDPTDERLSDLLLFIDTDSGNNGNVLNTGPVDVRFVDENTVVAGLLITPVNIGETIIRFDTIVSGIEQFDEVQPTRFNIGEHISIEKSIVVPGAEIVEISAITLDNGRLTIAHRQSDVSVYGWGSATLGLMKPDGEIIWSNSGASGIGVPGQQDYFEIGNISPNDLTLVWRGMRAENTIVGNWEFAVTGENIINPCSLNGEFDGNEVEVTLGATIVEIKIYADYVNNEFPYDYLAEDAVTLLLKDGTTVHTRADGIMCDSTMASFGYGMSFVNPANVVSVEFYGVTIVSE
jgi:hypothetical protein